jgi:hypothetical protein
MGVAESTAIQRLAKNAGANRRGQRRSGFLPDESYLQASRITGRSKRT